MPIDPNSEVLIDTVTNPGPDTVLPTHPATEWSLRRLIEVAEGITGGGGGGGDASAANQVTEIDRLTSILSKIIAAPATEAKQDTQITAEQAILAKLSSDPATQATLAAILAKLNASLAVTGTFWQATQPVSTELGGVIDVFNTVVNVALKKIIGAANAPLLFRNIGADATKNVKASAGNVYSLSCYNVGVSFRFLQLFNTATIPGGLAVPLLSFAVPAKSQIIVGTDFFNEEGIFFDTGIAFGYSNSPNNFAAGTAAEQNTFVTYK